MKIISKYKDYYDYISGVYGEDPKKILDRRNFEYNPYRFKDDGIDFVTLFIAGKRIEGVYQYFKFYYGEELKKLCAEQTKSKNSKYWWSWHRNKYPKDYYSYFKYDLYDEKILNTIVDDDLQLNKKYNCPILIQSSIGRRTEQINVERWPILGDLGLASYIQPEVIYKWLEDWLSQRETEKETQRGITITNVEKLQSKGFDNKRSFRPKMK